MCIIPTYKSLEEEDVMMQFLRKTMLRKIIETIKPKAEGLDNQNAISRTLIAFEEIQKQKFVAENTYFGRVWVSNSLPVQLLYLHQSDRSSTCSSQSSQTLAERMARDGQKDRICHWLPLTIFIGMGIDTLLNLIEGLEVGMEGHGHGLVSDKTGDKKHAMSGELHAAKSGDINTAKNGELHRRSDGPRVIPDRSKIFLKMIGPEAQDLMLKTSEALAGPVMDCLTDIEQPVRELAAECFINLASVWAKGQNPDFVESPTKEWLKRYLTEEDEFKLYLAWSKADRVWAVFSYFSAQNPEQLNKQLHVKAALDRLSRCAGVHHEQEVESFASDALEDLPEQVHIVARVPSLHVVSGKSQTNKVHPLPSGQDAA